VFVHGWASDHTVWRDQMSAFRGEDGRPRWRLIAVDLPGHGKSKPPEDGYSMDSLARGIAQVMDDAGVEHAVLVGHSNGTPVVRQFARLFPDRTLGLVTVDGALRQIVTPEQAEPYIKMLEADDYRETAEKMFNGMIPPDWPEADRELVLAMMRKTSQEAMIGGLKASLDPAIWTDDPIEKPLLVINAKSPFWTEAYLEKVREIAPQMEYHELEGVTHFLMLDEPETFNALVADFITEHDLLD